jgi:hypothetical protein
MPQASSYVGAVIGGAIAGAVGGATGGAVSAVAAGDNIVKSTFIGAGTGAISGAAGGVMEFAVALVMGPTVAATTSGEVASSLAENSIGRAIDFATGSAFAHIGK